MNSAGTYIIWIILFAVLMAVMAVILYVFWQWDNISQRLAEKQEQEEREKEAKDEELFG